MCNVTQIWYTYTFTMIVHTHIHVHVHVHVHRYVCMSSDDVCITYVGMEWDITWL